MGAGGVKNLSVGICDGAPSTARSSLACNDKNAFFTFEQPKRYKLWSCKKCAMLYIFFWPIYS